ncbi:proline dehydrogenase family protein [Rapidithrix thailandica]|uniref:proline dehydrogenase n=1 Tax=Rapidithrix thailandica TaxID=413964 RepID=A0AAW9SHX4_9BACT
MDIEKSMNSAANALRKAALNENAKSYLLQNEQLFSLFKKAANRYIAGETLAEAMAKVNALNTLDVACTVDFMGESIRTEEEANTVTQEFIKLAEAIKKDKRNCTISLDVSHIGLTVDRELGLSNLQEICKQGVEVIISAEGTDRTDDVMNTYIETVKQYSHLGITLQAYLHRSEDDLKELMNYAGKIRVVKGAFATPEGESFKRGKELDERYLNFVRSLLETRHKCSVATHDPNIQTQVSEFIATLPNASNYEFEGLLGIENEQLFSLNQLHPSRIYIVYGTEWYLYLCNRIAEYPPSIFQAISDIVDG